METGLPDSILRALERLAEANIEILPVADLTTHIVFVRDGFAALVARSDSGFGEIGSAGKLTDGGLAVLVQRRETFYFVTKSRSDPAGPTEIEALQRFSRDLKVALDV